MSLARRLRLRRKNDVWTKGSGLIALLAILWLMAIVVMPFVIATAALVRSYPATLVSAFDSCTATIVFLGIGLLAVPRCRRALSWSTFSG